MDIMEKTIDKKERIYYYDLLRAIAIIMVILCHVDIFFGAFDSELKIILIPGLHRIALTGVPIFLMISGALLLNKDYTLSYFLKRRFARIIYPFIFWMGLILIIGYFYFNWSNTQLWNVFIGNPGISWFFWMLIGIYLFLPVINVFIKEYKLKGIEYFLLIWFITMILNSLNKFVVFPDFNLIYFSGFIGYPILGYYLDNKDFKYNDSKMLIAIIILLISWFTYAYCGYYGIEILNPLYLNIPNVFMGVGVFLLIKYANEFNLVNKSDIIRKIVVSISICSYGMYYAHFLVLLFLEKLDIHSFKLVPLLILLIIFMSWLLTYIFSKIPYLKRFSGV
jgi:surface polysaccharide O-acyltransferase-like enzyme